MVGVGGASCGRPRERTIVPSRGLPQYSLRGPNGQNIYLVNLNGPSHQFGITEGSVRSSRAALRAQELSCARPTAGWTVGGRERLAAHKSFVVHEPDGPIG